MLTKNGLLILTVWLILLAALAGAGSKSAASETSSLEPVPLAKVAMPKWLEPPALDGRCGDLAYAHAEVLTLTDMVGQTAAQALLLHSGHDAFLCLSNIPATSPRIAMRIDGDHSRGKLFTAGDYEFSVSVDGFWCAQHGDPKGDLIPLRVPAGDVNVVVNKADEKTWGAEISLSLEWLGGYARIDGFNLALEAADGRLHQQWPRHANARTPSTWGDLELGPLYTDSVHAGSAFFDGRDGYMVVPFAPELNPREITIEAWARVAEGGCGALVGNGQAASYWMALCEQLRFTHGGATSVFSGVSRLDNGWHHVAVTVDRDGQRTFYVDGEVDRRPGWSPKGGEEDEGAHGSAVKLGASDRMLRLGSDRDAPEEQRNLHGYVRELRIWNRVRSASEIREAAFRSLNGNEAGLVGLWPFTKGLQDIAGGHDAGLIGDASLARETSDVKSFKPIPAPVPHDPPPAPTPPPAWDARIPFSPKQVRVDGVCRPAEYEDAARVTLEPEHSYSLDLMQTKDALVLCTSPLWGQRNAREGVTLWINRDGQAGASPGPEDLRVHLSADGGLTVKTGDGRGFDGPAPQGIESRTTSDVRFHPQDDIAAVNARWFSTEVRIPLEVLRPFKAGDKLRFALEYQGTVPPKVLRQFNLTTQPSARWPSAFDPQRPETWGVATTGESIKALTNVGNEGRKHAAADRSSNLNQARDVRASGPTLMGGSVRLLKAAMGGPPAPSPPPSPAPPTPTSIDYQVLCPQGLLDLKEYISDPDRKWHLVKDAYPFVQVEGYISTAQTHANLSAPVSNEDWYSLHDSNDLDMKIDVSPSYEWAVLNGGLQNRSLVLETESAGFDADWRPGPDDHATVLGNWIFDCGHGGPNAKTEIHPIYAMESDRLEVLPLFNTKTMQQVRRVRVSMNSNPGRFRHASLEPFSFSVNLPPAVGAAQVGAGINYFMRVTRGDANMVSAQLDGQKVNITVHPPAEGKYGFELVIGRLNGPTVSELPDARLYGVNLTDIHINNDSDDDAHAPLDLGTIDELEGEWFFAAAVNGNWQQIFWYTSVLTGQNLDRADARLGAHDFYTTKPRLLWEVTAYEADALDADPGKDDELSSDRFDQGALKDLANSRGPHAIGMPNWTLGYSVTDVTDAFASLPLEQIPWPAQPLLMDTRFWSDALSGEPNESLNQAKDLGRLNVPLKSSSSDPEQNGSITGVSSTNGVRILTPDVDWYKFTLDDFADVTVTGLPRGSGVDHVLTPAFPNFSWLPDKVLTESGEQDLRSTLGMQGGQLKIFSNAVESGYVPYNFRIERKYKTLPRDWGEAADEKSGDEKGRLLDLNKVRPDPGTAGGALLKPETRSASMDWAWQHVPSDVDWYRLIPPPTTPTRVGTADEFVEGKFKCEYDNDASLVIQAGGMHLSIPTMHLEGDDSIIIDLSTQYTGGPILVKVSSTPNRKRGLYHFAVEWTQAERYNPGQCGAIRFHKTKAPGIAAYRRPRPGEPNIFYARHRGEPQVDNLVFQNSRAYQIIQMDEGRSLDMIISGMSESALTTRLYDVDGVMLGESLRLNDNTLSSWRGIPDKMTPQARLSIMDLLPGAFYYLQFSSPTNARKADRSPTAPVAISAIEN